MDYEAVKSDMVRKGGMARARFFTTYAKDVRGRPILGPDGTPRIEEMVELSHPGNHGRQAPVKNIKELRPDPDGDPDNESTAITRMCWEILEPQYRAWRMGQVAPETGTRLAAWPGLGAEQADVLKSFGIRTLEEFRGATDSVLTRIPLPGIRVLQQDCALFMDSRDTQAVARSLEAKDAQIATMEEQLAFLKQAVIEMQAAAEDKPKGKRKAPVDKDFMPDAQEEAA